MYTLTLRGTVFHSPPGSLDDSSVIFHTPRISARPGVGFAFLSTAFPASSACAKVQAARIAAMRATESKRDMFPSWSGAEARQVIASFVHHEASLRGSPQYLEPVGR